MPQIIESVRIAAESEDLWREIGAFNAVGQWHPMLAKVESEGNRAGCKRIAEARDGSRQVERLIEFAPDQHFYRYEMEFTAMPVRHYVGEFRIEDCPDRTSNVIWSAHFALKSADAAGATETVRSFLKAGLDHLADMHGGAATLSVPR
jgi:hypothetical protein